MRVADGLEPSSQGNRIAFDGPGRTVAGYFSSGSKWSTECWIPQSVMLTLLLRMTPVAYAFQQERAAAEEICRLGGLACSGSARPGPGEVRQNVLADVHRFGEKVTDRRYEVAAVSGRNEARL
jgi:hypothetical protein